jgi:hypothetical protein
MFSDDRQTHRRVFIEAWRKAGAGEPLEPLETQIVEIMRMHPEYHPHLDHGEAVMDRDWLPEGGETNPFLHLGLHLTVLEQVGLDRPPGVRKLYRRLIESTGDVHEADHIIMECLAEAIWRISHDGKSFNEKAYLKCIKRSGGGARPRER